MGSVRVAVPPGYNVDLDQPVGTEVGYLFADLSEVSRSLDGSFIGEFVVDQPAKYATDEQAQRCAPGTHAAVWRADMTVLGQALSFPIFVDRPASASASGGAELRFCPYWPNVGIPGGLFADSLSLFFTETFSTPSAPGRYTWSALVEPAQPGSFAPDPASAFELRSVILHPYAVTLRARHDAKAQSVVLSGRVTAMGVPEQGIAVQFGASVESSSEFAFFGPVRTNAAGEFSVRRRIHETTRFSASAEGKTQPCSSPSSAPAGCLVETVPPPMPASVTVKVRGPFDAKLVPRRGDQALARRLNLKLSDFPGEWTTIAAPNPFFPCRGFRPNLSKLTVQGASESPVFLSEEPLAAAWSASSIYVSTTQARTAFEREAQLAAARCVATVLRRDGTTVEKVAPVSFPRFGGQTRAFRIVVSDPEAPGYIDLVWMRHGRAVVHVGFLATNPSGIEADLLAKVAARAPGR